MKSFVLPIFFFGFFSHIQAQPGELDLTKHYSYTILNEKGEEISFLKDKNYSIMVDDVLYKSPHIPQDGFPELPSYHYRKETYVHINDFSLFTPYDKNEVWRETQPEIKIIQSQDTMFLHQATRSGDFDKYKNVEKLKPTKKSDITLRFLAGRYHFPHWTKRILENLPEVTGSVKIVNLLQVNFIIPKEIYDLMPYSTSFYCLGQECDLYKLADEFVLQQFIEPFYSFQKEEEYTFIENDISISNPIIKAIYPTHNKHKFSGIMEYNASLYGKKIGESKMELKLFTLDVEKNTLDFWTLDEENSKIITYKIYADTFNTIFYNATLIQDTSGNDEYFKQPRSYPSKNFIYRSLDKGETWKKDKELTQFFNVNSIREFEFLDKEYALAYTHNAIPVYRLKPAFQGVYYLLRNLEVIDSLKSPENIDYANSYNHFNFIMKNDTVFIGNWSGEQSYITRFSYTQPYLIKSAGKWRFQTMEKTGDRTELFIPKTQIRSTDGYQSFTLIDKHKLEFKNHEGTLILNSTVIDNQKTEQYGAYQLIENGSEIYLINRYLQFLLFSDNGGLSWFFYPYSIGDVYNYGLQVEMNGNISFMNNTWEKEASGRKIKKMSYRFLVN